jgi:hypothetical protein
MMTLKLWRALNNPPATHPIFVRTVLLPRVVRRRSINSASIFIGFIMSMSEFMPTILVFLMPILLGSCGLIYGIDCAVRVSQSITYERKNNTYDLLALCPQGVLAACWVLCTSLLFQQQQFSRLHEIVRTSVRIAFAAITVILMLFIGITASIIFSGSKLTLPIIIPLVNAEAMVVLIYSEYVQSTVIGCLVGLLIPTFASGTMDSFLYAPAVFLLLKIGSYTTSLLVGFNLLDKVFKQIDVQSLLVGILLTVARVVIIVMVQDIVIRLLWRMVIERTNTLPADAELALYPQRRR